jgi:hypothetical protein
VQKGDARRGGKSTSEVGSIAELAVATALTSAGFAVFIPFFSSHSRVDLLYINRVGEVRRVQCKSAHYKNDVILFYTCSHTGGVARGYVGDVDEFGVYSPDTGSVYLVPVDAVPTRLACLRNVATRNNQARGIRWAKDYLLGPPW